MEKHAGAARHRLAEALEGAGAKNASRKLRWCGTRMRVVRCRGEEQLEPMGCHAAFCPVCRLRRKQTLYARLEPWILDRLGPQGIIISVSLGLPLSSAGLTERFDTLSKEIRTFTSNKPWRARFRSALGLILALEVAEGTEERGHPHAHMLLFGQHPGTAHDFVDWFTRRGADRNPGFRLLSRDIRIHRPEGAGWRRALSYVLKGTDLQPDWPAELLAECAALLSRGRQCLTFLGLAKRPGGWSRAQGFARKILLKPAS